MTRTTDPTPGSGFILSRSDRTMIVQLDRAEKANALTPAMMKNLTAIVSGVSDNPDVRGIVITGGPAKVFCAGADVRPKPGDVVVDWSERRNVLRDLLLAIIDCPKPVVAAVNGPAIGAGAMLAIVADVAVAAPSATLAIPEIELGMPSPLGASVVSSVAGAVPAHDLLLSGRRMDAQEALAQGLLTAVVSAGDLQVAALKRCADMAEKSASAFKANKRWLRRSLRSDIMAAAAETERLHQSMGQS
jgi:enoyl-CoA hydratase/carnithine racemase